MSPSSRGEDPIVGSPIHVTRDSQIVTEVSPVDRLRGPIPGPGNVPLAGYAVLLTCKFDGESTKLIPPLLAKWPHFANPVDALELLDAKFADAAVRQYAVDCLDDLSNEQLCDYLLQLVQAHVYR